MGFTIVETLFPLVFLLMFGFALYTLISSAAARAQEKRKNDASPRLSVPASVVTKRAQVGTTHHHNAATNTGGTYYNTKYFATFQFESGDRLELPVDGSDYGLLVEGDTGKLSFQGTRYLGFQRGSAASGE